MMLQKRGMMGGGKVKRMITLDRGVKWDYYSEKKRLTDARTAAINEKILLRQGAVYNLQIYLGATATSNFSTRPITFDLSGEKKDYFNENFVNGSNMSTPWFGTVISDIYLTINVLADSVIEEINIIDRGNYLVKNGEIIES